MTRYVLVIEVDDEAPRAGLSRAQVTERLASVLSLGVFDGVTVTVQTAPRDWGPTTVRVHGGTVHTTHEPHPPSSEESHDPSAQTDVCHIIRIPGTSPDVPC